MNATELAHWRYRVKGLEAELPQWKKWESDSRTDTWLSPDSEMFKDIHHDTLATLEFTRYLLEEARYMVELGELTLQ